MFLATLMALGLMRNALVPRIKVTVYDPGSDKKMADLLMYLKRKV